MPPETIPRDPVYMTYITNHHQHVPQPSPERTPSPYRPTTGLTYTDLELQSTRYAYQHFHRPFNDHSRYLAVASPTDKAVYRDLPRLAPQPWDGSTPDYDRATAPRPASAPGGSGRHSTGGGGGGTYDVGEATLLDNMTTRTGAPCYTVSSLLEADLQTGSPLLYPEEEGALEDWRVARVQTYQVPPSRVGYGDGGARPFHQDYRHYKYFGFAGCGAKTSWAHNPKYGRIYAEASAGARDPATLDAPPPPPLYDTVGGHRRPLTAAERSLVGQFSSHNYGMEGVPSDPTVAAALADAAAGRSPRTQARRGVQVPSRYRAGQLVQTQAQAQAQGTGRSDGGGVSGLQYAPIIEPFNAKVDLQSRHSLPPDTDLYGSATAARVTTYRQLASPYAAEINRSPNHGSQSPWHQRYAHYKQSGFAGKGATSSWARNPKYAKMYD